MQGQQPTERVTDDGELRLLDLQAPDHLVQGIQMGFE